MKGVYVLILSIHNRIAINVGGLGKRIFEKGLYAYVGSAQTNLMKRVWRHARRRKKKFWHVDYLLSNREVEIIKVLYEEAGRIEECAIAGQIAQRAIPMNGFGSSDCKCSSHLFKIEAYDYLSAFMNEIEVKS
jgi:Uri superfamily endonuclease